jgi:inner membrane protein
MGVSSLAAERLTRQAAEARGHGPIAEVVATPVPANPFRREMVFSTGAAYGYGELRWTPSPELRLRPGLFPTNMADPAVAEARGLKAIDDFLYWSRLPYARIERRPDGTIVTIADARYGEGGRSNFVRTVRLPPLGAQQGEAAPGGP